MNGLQFLSRTSDQRCWNLMSYHSPHSLTWRWVLSFMLFRADEARVRPLWWGYRDNSGYMQWGVRIPFVGMLSMRQQRPMWFRDLFYEQRGEVDGLRHEMSMPRPVPAAPQTERSATLH